ncbi:MAG TPA: hypothetical protein VGP76_21540 [Planctomycetaceae bacterium]|nr:hypothetical protein [Planctomycetaceae bacterium]
MDRPVVFVVPIQLAAFSDDLFTSLVKRCLNVFVGRIPNICPEMQLPIATYDPSNVIDADRRSVDVLKMLLSKRS